MLNEIKNEIDFFVKRIMRNHVGAYAAQSAYFIILSFIPFLMLLVGLVRYIPGVQQFAMDSIVNGVPNEGQYMVREVINEVYAKTTNIMPVTIVVALWSSSKGFMAIGTGLNVINDVVETRNYFYIRFRSVLYTVFFLLAIMVTLLLVVFGKNIQHILVKYWPFVSKITSFILQFSTLITMCFLMIVFLLFYTYLPNCKQKLRDQIPGAMLASVSWTVFSFCFSVYFTYFSDGTNMYGSLAAVMLIMIWLYVCMYLFMLGAEVNIWLLEKK